MPHRNAPKNICQRMMFAEKDSFKFYTCQLHRNKTPIVKFMCTQGYILIVNVSFPKRFGLLLAFFIFPLNEGDCVGKP